MSGGAPTVALLLWSDSFDDFLASIGLTFEQFRDEMTGGWAFGYVQALATAGVRVVLVCVSARAREVERHVHAPTGAPILVLPAPAAYRLLRGPARAPVRAPAPAPVSLPADGASGPARRAWPVRAARTLLHDVRPYLATPRRLLARELAREGCAAIVCQEYEDPRFDHVVAIGKALGIPVFATFQGGSTWRSRLERFVRARSIRRAAGLVIGSGGEVARVRERYGVEPERIGRVVNPLDLSLWYPEERDEARRALGWPADARIALWHGRVERHRKGLDVLLDAWLRVRAGRPAGSVRLQLVGMGSDAAWLREWLARHPGADVHWRDEYLLDRAVLRRALSAADVSVLPSRHEGFPVAPMEAMACGTGVVAADVPGIGDILDEGEASGGIVVPRDDPGALARELARVLDDADLSATLGRRARSRARSAFSLEAVGARLHGFLTARGASLGDASSLGASPSDAPPDAG